MIEESIQNPEKVDAVQALPTPTNITELQEFLGIVTYLYPFIPGLSTLTAPLHELLKKDAELAEMSPANQPFNVLRVLFLVTLPSNTFMPPTQ